ncbi:MAG: cytidine deaminase [Proteobacteria bacterium]|nr:MAG: cytidine deaminase [Pseudomonadota bacterium]
MTLRLTKARWDRLAEAALAARKQAYAPYSRFNVGAALLLPDDTIVRGCNVENASYGLALCAERNAFGSAVAQGEREFRAIAVATQSSPPGPPCGLCLQTMAELCEDLDILLVNPEGERQRAKLSQLMRQPFRWKGAGTKSWKPPKRQR